MDGGGQGGGSSEGESASDFAVDEEESDAALSEEAEEEDDFEEKVKKKKSGKRTVPSGKKREASSTEEGVVLRAEKKQKVAHGLSGKDLIRLTLASDKSNTADRSSETSKLPVRSHSFTYHLPLLLDDRIESEGAKARRALLDWYTSVKRERKMPWRQQWIDPSADASTSALTLKRHAYRVWISEIMLQQTRVATVIDYFNRWMDKWPNIEDLASAKEEEVLSAWKGLGYYSRSARIHQAAKKVVADKSLKGMLPELPEELIREVPGVGPYTAGAISSIVFGHAVPLLDGNVARVLSRQAGILANTKEKALTDLMWEAARRLVRRASLDQSKDASETTGKQQHAKVVGTEVLARSSVPVIGTRL